MDEVVQKLVALGVPGLVLLAAMSVTGLAGGAAIVAALALLGGPAGMLGGLAVLGTLTLVANGISRYGVESIFKRVVDGLVAKGNSAKEIRAKIENYPISRDLKRRLIEGLDNYDRDEKSTT